MMNCVQFEERVQTLLDQRYDPSSDATLRGHTARCLACRQSLAGYSRLQASVTPAAALRASRLASPPAHRHRRLRIAAIAAAVAAAILLTQSTSPLGGRAPVGSAELAQSAFPPQGRPLAAQPAASPDVSPTRQIAELPTSTTVPPAGGQDLRDLVSPYADLAGATLATQPQFSPPVASVTAPLARPFSATLDALRRAWRRNDPSKETSPQARLQSLDIFWG